MKLRSIAILALVLVVVLGTAGVASAQSSATHTVQPGETLYSIARQYGVTAQAIAFANGITNPNLIFPGQVLTIPGVAAPTPPPGKTPVPGSTSTYTVVGGDTLYSIARRSGTDIATLVALNGLANPNQIFPGQVLKLPSSGTSPTATSAGPTNTPGPTATTAPTPNVTYTVQVGDTLSSIALRFNTTYQEIALLNGLSNPNLISAGQVLIIRKGSATATATPTTAPSPTKTGTPATALPGGFKTPTPIVSGTQVPANAANRLQNPDFETDTHAAGDATIKVVNGWEPFYCDKPYTADYCPALRIGSGNQAGMVMSRPAYDKTTTSFRVHGGLGAQMWTCAFAACRGGVYQTVDTIAGSTCEAGAYVQSWSNNDASSFTSQLLSEDDRANSTWSIRVDPAGGTAAFKNGLPSSRGFAYDDGVYDKYTLISYTFPVTTSSVTVFFEDLRLWPFANNASFIDDAYVRCTQ